MNIPRPRAGGDAVISCAAVIPIRRAAVIPNRGAGH
jgi:hypothetical protein